MFLVRAGETPKVPKESVVLHEACGCNGELNSSSARRFLTKLDSRITKTLLDQLEAKDTLGNGCVGLGTDVHLHVL